MHSRQSELAEKMVTWLAGSDLNDPAAVAVSHALHEMTQPLRIVAHLACGVDADSVHSAYRRCIDGLRSVSPSTEAVQSDSKTLAVEGPARLGVREIPELIVELGWVQQTQGDAYCHIRTNSEDERCDQLQLAITEITGWSSADRQRHREAQLAAKLDRIACVFPHVRNDFEELRWGI